MKQETEKENEKKVSSPSSDSIPTNKEKDKEKEKAENPVSARAKKPKVMYAEFVSMTETEYEDLVRNYGYEATERMIGILDNYKGSKGVSYKSDYRAILSWVVDRYQRDAANKPTCTSSDSDWLRDIADYSARLFNAGDGGDHGEADSGAGFRP